MQRISALAWLSILATLVSGCVVSPEEPIDVVFTGSDSEATAIAEGYNQRATEDAATMQVYEATPRTPTPEPTCYPGTFGCERAAAATFVDVLVNTPEATPIGTPVATVTTRAWIPFMDFPGEGNMTQQLGRFAAGVTLEVYRIASGGHYLMVYPRGYIESVIDLNSDMTQTTCIDHAWEHAMACHAHLWGPNGELLAQVYSGNPVFQILETDEEHAQQGLVLVLLDAVWVRSEDVR